MKTVTPAWMCMAIRLVAINSAVPFEMVRLKQKTGLNKGGLRRFDAV